MPAVVASGTQLATGAEDTLNSPTGSGSYVLLIDLTNLANGDMVQLRGKRKVLSSGTIRTIGGAAFTNARTNDLQGPVVQLGPFSMPYGGTFTLQQVRGTNRNYDWSVEIV